MRADNRSNSLNTRTSELVAGFGIDGSHVVRRGLAMFDAVLVIGTPNGSVIPQGRLLDVAFHGPAWLTGGVLGTEASFLMYPALALLWLFIWWRYRNNPRFEP